jgi:RNA polymerase sigma-70 factor (ECF subfamily)
VKGSRTDAARIAVARLPESQRIVVHLYGYEGLTFEQIAEVLGTTAEAVRARASAGYQRLQAELKGYLRSSGGS